MRFTRKSSASARNCRPGVELRPFYDQSEIVNDSIKSVRDAILIGLVLASLIMVLFLRDWGTSLVAGLVIPATIAVTFIALRVMNESFNLMTLGGLAAAVGLVIDDAIVVVENIVMHRDSGQSRAEAIRSAIREIRVPLVGSTITPIVVFLPLISITGVTGVFFRALAVTVGMALLTSLALALTWTPTLSHYFIREPLERRDGGAPQRAALVRCAPTSGCCASRSSTRSCWPLPLLSDRRLVRLLRAHRYRPAAGDGRRRLHHRLHHARGLVARRDQPRHHPRGADSARHAGSGEHLAPHRPATRSGRGHRGQHRRHFGEAEARPQARRPRR